MKKVFLFDDDINYMKRVKFFACDGGDSWDVIIPEEQPVLSLFPAGYVIDHALTFVLTYVGVPEPEYVVFTREGRYAGRLYIYRD
jgi:hypothetical protein